MIDEAFDTEFEARLRATLDEMIPKLVASAPIVNDGVVATAADVVVTRRATPIRQSRSLVGAVLAVAATILGLIVIAGRHTDHVTTGDTSPATDDGPPAWYDLIRASLPERFPYVALTLAEDPQIWFVAISPTEGKVLDIQLALEGYSVGPITVVDATGEWHETAQGWTVRTPEGLFVSVACGIGLGGRDFVTPDNYCERTSGVLPFTKDEIRTVANALATSLTVSIFDQDVGSPLGDTIDTAQATALIAATVPGEQISATDLGNGADHIYNAGHESAAPDPAGTSVRILHGIYPAPPVTGEPAAMLYEDAAVVWMYGTGGVVVRVSTTDSSPASVTRLEQLARDLLQLDPIATGEPTPTVPATTTTADLSPSIDITTTSDLTTTSTVSSCGQSNSSPTALVANASHDTGTAQLWTDALATNVPSVAFAEPANAIDQAPTSRVLSLAGAECEASLVAAFTTAAAVEPATTEILQSLIRGTLPAGTSIMVIIGDDTMAGFTTGVTTTVNPLG